MKDHIGQQQVIHMAAVTGHIHQLMCQRDRLDALDVEDLDAVVEATPEEIQQPAHDLQRDLRRVGENLVAIAADLAAQPCDRLPSLRGLFFQCRLQGVRIQNALDHLGAAGNTRPEGGLALAMQDLRQFPVQRLGREVVLLRQLAQAYSRREDQGRMPAVEQNREQAPQAPAHGPGIGKQNLQPVPLAGDGPAPEHRDRHQAEIEIRIFLQFLQQILEHGTAFGPLQQPVTERIARCHAVHRMMSAVRVWMTQGIGQAVALCHLLQHQQVRQPPFGKHIEDRVVAPVLWWQFLG